ncbi:hypothetical protein B7463_g9824, partial [Scytalidium lignicola]
MTDDRSLDECNVIPGKRSKSTHIIQQRRIDSTERENSRVISYNQPCFSNPRVDSACDQSAYVRDSEEDAEQDQNLLGTPENLPGFPRRKQWNPLQPIYHHFSGETTLNQALFSLILRDIVTGVPEFHQMIIAKDTNDSLSPEDVCYLQAKGAFSIPPIEYATPETFHKAGFESRLEMCQCYFTRAKLLFDMSYANDSLICAQSILLLSYWPVPLNRDFNITWHLLGIAIGLCQAAMPNFKVMASQQKYQTEEIDLIWQRIWWICVLYDGWLYVSNGRQLKIHECDYEVPMPLRDDIVNELEDLPMPIKYRYLPRDIPLLADYYLAHLNLVRCLRRFFNRANLAEDNVIALGDMIFWEADLERVEQETKGLIAKGSCSPNKFTKLAAFHLQACLGGAQISILEPYFLNELPKLPMSLNGGSAESDVYSKMTAAAARVITALEMIIGLNSCLYQRHWVATIMIRVTQFHLIQMSSSQPLERRVARHKVDTCIAIWDEIQKTIWKAESLNKLVKQAFEKVLGNGRLLVPVVSSLPLSENQGNTDSSLNDSDIAAAFVDYPFPSFTSPLDDYAGLLDSEYV